MTEKCGHCGMIHNAKCPLVKSIEYYEDGTVKRIEYMTPADYVTVPAYQYPIHRPIVVIPQPYNPPVIPYWYTTTTCGQINTAGGSHSTLYD